MNLKHEYNGKKHAYLQNTLAGLWAVIIFFSPNRPLTAAEEYATTQIAKEALINRNPVISETGLVAWSGHANKLPDGKGGTDIYIHLNGKTRSITQGVMDPRFPNIRPQVTGNAVIWQTIRPRENTLNRQVTWILKEDPEGQQDFQFPGWFATNTISIVEGKKHSLHVDPKGVANEGSNTNLTQDSEENEKRVIIREVTNIFGRVRQVTIPAETADPAAPQDTEVATDAVPSEVLLARQKTITFNEICRWEEGKAIEWITYDSRNDLGLSVYGELMAWQKAKAFPYGWEIMALDGTNRLQLTTNFYYDMAPKVHERKVTWYGWDGNDYEIFLWDADARLTTQITSNQYDDVSPQIWKGEITWEGYASRDARIYHYKDGTIKQLSKNTNSAVNPRVWDGKVVWQGFDGKDFEIYYFDGNKAKQITNNNYDDVNPAIRDGIVAWMGYKKNWDAEIFAYDGKQTVQLTDNDIEEKNPQTAGGKIVWQTDDEHKTQIYLAVPKAEPDPT